MDRFDRLNYTWPIVDMTSATNKKIQLIIVRQKKQEKPTNCDFNDKRNVLKT